MIRRRTSHATLVASLVLIVGSTSVWASPDELFAAGSSALSAGRYEDAIAAFEAYADRGAWHPDASYDRGFAYLMRVRAGAERPGDLGKAAAAFEETLVLRPEDDEAGQALGLVRAELARRRARQGKEAVVARPSLGHVLASLASARTWGIGAMISAALVAFGMALAWWARDARRRSAPADGWLMSGRGAQVIASVLVPVAAIGALILGALYFTADKLQLESAPAVVVVAEAPLVDANGAPLGPVVPEGARVEIGRQAGRRFPVRWGTHEGWLPSTAVRILAKGN